MLMQNEDVKVVVDVAIDEAVEAAVDAHAENDESEEENSDDDEMKTTPDTDGFIKRQSKANALPQFFFFSIM